MGGGGQVEVYGRAGDQLEVDAIGRDPGAEHVAATAGSSCRPAAARARPGRPRRPRRAERVPRPDDQPQRAAAVGRAARALQHGVLRRPRGKRLPHHQTAVGPGPGRTDGDCETISVLAWKLPVTSLETRRPLSCVAASVPAPVTDSTPPLAFSAAGQAGLADVPAAESLRAVRVGRRAGHLRWPEGIELTVQPVDEEHAAGHRDRPVDRRGQLIAVQQRTRCSRSAPRRCRPRSSAIMPLT